MYLLYEFPWNRIKLSNVTVIPIYSSFFTLFCHFHVTPTYSLWDFLSYWNIKRVSELFLFFFFRFHFFCICKNLIEFIYALCCINIVQKKQKLKMLQLSSDATLNFVPSSFNSTLMFSHGTIYFTSSLMVYV